MVPESDRIACLAGSADYYLNHYGIFCFTYIAFLFSIKPGMEKVNKILSFYLFKIGIIYNSYTYGASPYAPLLHFSLYFVQFFLTAAAKFYNILIGHFLLKHIADR